MINFKTRIIVLSCLISLVNGRFINPLYLHEAPQRPYKEINELELITDGKYENSLQSAIGIVIRNPRLSETDWSLYNIREPSGFGTYVFGYDNVIDPVGNEHYRTEEKLGNGTLIGEYGFTDYQNQRITKVAYVADNRGYRANTKMISITDLLTRNL